MSPRPSNLTLPNVLSALRMASVPLLLWLAWTGRGRDYLIVFCVAYATDFLDGQLARRLKQETELGAMLDQVADVLVLLTGPLALWWVWPEILRREAWFIGAVLCLYAASVGCSFAKFGRLATYHAWFGKVSTATLAIGSEPGKQGHIRFRRSGTAESADWIIELFGKVDFEPGYDYKKQRRRK